jgi:hypothetical protein
MTPHRIDASDYYDLNPRLEHAPGDVWVNMPTFGLLADQPTSGLVITPACDLLNRKVATVTYLPILPLCSYLASVFSLPEITRELAGQLSVFGKNHLLQSDQPYIPPAPSSVERAIEEVTSFLARPAASSKEKSAATRALAGLRLTADIASGLSRANALADLKLLFGKRLSVILRDIVRNSYRGDVHFMPSDKQPSDWSAIPDHSIALFRCPMTVPVEILDRAQDTPEFGWKDLLAGMSHRCASVSAFATIES